MAVLTRANEISDLLVAEGVMTEDQRDAVLAEAKEARIGVAAAIVKLGIAEERVVTRVFAQKYRVPTVDLSKIELTEKVLRLFPAEVAVKYLSVPLKKVGRTLTVAMVNPSDLGAIDDLKFMTRLEIEPVLAGEFSLRAMLETHYEAPDGGMDDLLDLVIDEGDLEFVDEEEEEVNVAALREQVEQAPVVKFINGLLTDAVLKGVSDIHIEPYEKDIRVRYRIDGALQEVMKPPMKMKAALTSRIKILADLNIAERRLPQDGRIKLRMKKKVVDFRVSTLPVIFGEKIVLRILDAGNLTFDLSKFGFEPQAERDFMDAIANPYGMVLVTGPTGSGKTTTLYSALSKVNNEDVNIMTAEDPVEYNLHGINQVLVRTEIGMTFAASLKAFLRQDPNIIMVGEIRDLETGGISIKAALTGHLVLSTLHTNDAPSTITRLLDMGLEPFNVAAALNLITAQRLLRRICAKCKTQVTYTEEYLRAAKLPEGFYEKTAFYRGEGCEKCGGSGYAGRQGLYEVMAINPAIRRLIMQGSGTDELREAGIDSGMLTLRMDGLKKIEQGLTTLEEVVKETAAY